MLLGIRREGTWANKTPRIRQTPYPGRNSSISRYHPCAAAAYTDSPLQPPTRLRPLTAPPVRPLSGRRLRDELYTNGTSPARTFRRLSEEALLRLFPFTVFWCIGFCDLLYYHVRKIVKGLFWKPFCVMGSHLKGAQKNEAHSPRYPAEETPLLLRSGIV